MQFPFKLETGREFDVIGFGTNAVDYLIQVPKYPAFNSKVELTDYVQAAGGEVATTMVGLQRLGLNTSYIGRFGDDLAGKIGSTSLADEGVNIDLAEFVKDTRTQVAFIIIDEGTGERTVIWQRESGLSYGADEAPINILKRASMLHITPHDVQACISMAVAARENGAVVSVDIDNIFEGVEELMSHVDVLVASAEFPQRFTGIANQRTAISAIQDNFGCSVVGVTLGESGSLIRCNGNFIETAGFAVPGGCKDTTGAGDAFRVGLLYGILTGKSVEDSARAANAVAALKCRAVGARTSLPSRAELEGFLT